MSVVVNVILSLISVMIRPPAWCILSLCTVVKLCTLGVLTLGVSAYMGGTRCSRILSSSGDVLEMRCMCLARGGLGGVGGEWVTGFIIIHLLGNHCCEVMYFGCFDFRGECVYGWYTVFTYFV